MSADAIASLGKVAGVAGIALGVLLLVFRDVLRRTVFAALNPQNSYRLLRLIIVLTWSVAIAGMVIWWLATPGRVAGAPTWQTSRVLMSELRSGLSRSYVVQSAGEPLRSVELEDDESVDYYGDPCCGEFWLYYSKGKTLTDFAVKLFKKPFDFKLYYAIGKGNFQLGKTTFAQLGDPLRKADGFMYRKGLCNVEVHYFGQPGGYKTFYVATLLAKDWFDGEKLKSHREWPIESIYVTDGSCESDKDCLFPMAQACNWFDDYYS